MKAGRPVVGVEEVLTGARAVEAGDGEGGGGRRYASAAVGAKRVPRTAEGRPAAPRAALPPPLPQGVR